MFFFRCSWKDWHISILCIFVWVGEAVCAKKWFRVDDKFNMVAFSSSLNHFKNPTGRNYWLLSISKVGFLGRKFSKFFFKMLLENSFISLLCIFIRLAETLYAKYWPRIKGTVHSVAFFGPLNDFKNATSRNYWLLSIWKSWIFGSKIFKDFYSDVLGKIDISRFNACFLWLQRQCTRSTVSSSRVCSIW